MTATSSPSPARFATLLNRPRVWAIASIHADIKRLKAMHDALEARLQTADGLVYLGNMIGRLPAGSTTIDELLSFRRGFIARHGSFADDLVYLRGSQEEMWQKLLELQFAPDPVAVFRWMVEHGVGATLESYGFAVRDAEAVMRQGPLAITRWTNAVRATINAAPGHAQFLIALRRAAYTAANELLFVNAGIDSQRPLATQKDSFWWGGSGFFDLREPYSGYRRVIRGFDRHHDGLRTTDYAVSLDHGCGFGGGLIAACFRRDGEIVDCFEV
jgi:serine/threonine protein phosphatase 1